MTVTDVNVKVIRRFCDHCFKTLFPDKSSSRDPTSTYYHTTDDPKKKNGGQQQQVSSDEDDEKLTGSLWRQYLVIFLVNLVTLLQGASLPTSTVTVTQIRDGTAAAEGDNTFPREFQLTVDQATEVGKMI